MVLLMNLIGHQEQLCAVFLHFPSPFHSLSFSRLVSIWEVDLGVISDFDCIRQCKYQQKIGRLEEGEVRVFVSPQPITTSSARGCGPLPWLQLLSGSGNTVPSPYPFRAKGVNSFPLLLIHGHFTMGSQFP